MIRQKKNWFSDSINAPLTQAPVMEPVKVTLQSIKEAINGPRKKRLLEIAGFLEERGITGLTKAIEERGIPEVIFAESGIYYIIRAAFSDMGIEIKESRFMKPGNFAFSWDKNLNDFKVEIEFEN